MNPAVGYHRSHAFSYLKYLFVAQVAFSLAVCGFTPSGICDDATIQHWVVAVMSWAAPTMLAASHGCAANGVLLFFHAVMVSIWPLFAIAAAALILTAPRVHSVSAKSPIKPRTSRITLVMAYALVALLLAFLAAAVFHGAYYELAGAPPLHTWRHQAVAALFNALWRLSPRAGLGRRQSCHLACPDGPSGASGDTAGSAFDVLAGHPLGEESGQLICLEWQPLSVAPEAPGIHDDVPGWAAKSGPLDLHLLG